MKKLFLSIAAVAMVFATSCQKENINEPEVQAEDNEFICVIDQNANPQNAPAVNDNKGTLAHIDGNNNVWWQVGDQIAYYGQEASEQAAAYHTLTCSATSDNKAYFSDPNKHFGQGEHKAYYPASLVVNNVLTLPSTITLDANKNAAQLPMYGYGDGTHYLTFHNMCAVLKITVPASVTTCNKIELNANEYICGPFTMDGTKAQVSTTSGDGYKKITVNAPTGTNFSGVVYVAIPEGTYTDFAILLKNSDDDLRAKMLESATLTANNIYDAEITDNTSVPSDCFCFTANDNNGVTIGMGTEGTAPTITLEYCKYDASSGAHTSWKSFTVGTTTINLAHQGDKVYFRTNGSSGPTSTGPYNNYNKFTSSGSGLCTVSGKIMYLRQTSNLITNIENTSYETENNFFTGLFEGMTNLASAANLELPIGFARNNTYRLMFKGCANLTVGPIIRATHSENGMLIGIYNGCRKLETLYLPYSFWHYSYGDIKGHQGDADTGQDAPTTRKIGV